MRCVFNDAQTFINNISFVLRITIPNTRCEVFLIIRQIIISEFFFLNIFSFRLFVLCRENDNSNEKSAFEYRSECVVDG